MKYDVEQFKREAERLIRAAFPVNSGKRSLELQNIEFVEPAGFGSIRKEYELKANGQDLLGKIRATFVLKEDGQVIDKDTLTIADVPYLSKRNTFIIGGNERVVVDVQKLKRGTYTTLKNFAAVTEILSTGKRKIEINYSIQDGLKAKISSKTLNIFALLNVLNTTRPEFEKAIENATEPSKTLKKFDSVTQGDIEKLFEQVIPAYRQKEAKNPQMKTAMIQEYFTDTEFDDEEKKVNQMTLGIGDNGMTKNFLLAAIKKTVDAAMPGVPVQADNKDDLRFQQFLTANEQFIEQLDSKIRESTYLLVRNLSSKEKDKVRKVWGSLTLSKDLITGLRKEDNVSSPDTLNPLELLSTQRRITLAGNLAGVSRDTAPKSMRNIQVSDAGRIDPVESPESGKIGLVRHLARDAEIKNNTIVEKYIVINNRRGSVNRTEELSPVDEYDKHIAFYEIDKVKRNGPDVELSGKVRARHQGKIVEVDASKIQYMDMSPHSQFGLVANLVPFSAHNDGNRMLMSASQQKQAINLVNRENPLVMNAVDETKTKTYEELVAEKASYLLRSPVNGVVEKVTDNEIVIKGADGKKVTLEKYNYFPLNQNGYINHEVKVKPGDEVKSGQLIADGWQTKNGTLALGVNARVGYMPWEGYNFEDGIVVSRSFAERMASEEVKIVEVPVYGGEEWLGGRGSNIKKQLAEAGVPADKLSKVDEDGIVKVGTEVAADDLLVGRIKVVKVLSAAGQLFAFLNDDDNNELKDKSKYVEGYLHGKVLRVEVQSGSGDVKQNIKISIAANKNLQVGDKIAGRHGNKGEVSLILEDDEVPVAEDGKKLDVILSPLGVPSRKNLGQILETNAGLIAEKTGQPYKVLNFDKKERKNILNKLKEIGYEDGKMKIINPVTGHPFENKITVGNQYMLKLMHKAEEKIQARSIGSENALYQMPAKRSGKLAGTKDNPQSMGEMEIHALQSHGAVHNILESTTLKADGVKDRVELYTALQDGKDLPAPVVPATLRVLEDKLKAAAVRMAPIRGGRETTLDDKFDKLMLRPVSDKEILSWSVGEVTKGTSIYSLAKEGQKSRIEKGGLTDPAVFKTDIEDKVERSKAERSNWAHITLPEPMPHPLFMDSSLNPYALLTGLKKTEVERIMKDNVGVITDPGDTGHKKGTVLGLAEIKKLQGDGRRFKVEYGGRALESMLKEVDVDAKIKEVEGRLKESTKEDEFNGLYKTLRVLNNLKENDLKPTDLMYKVVPVMPIALRPAIEQNDRLVVDGANYLYLNLLKASNAQKNLSAKMEEGSEPEENFVRGVNNLYSQLESLYVKGIEGEGNDAKKSILQTLKGKEGLIKDKILSKNMDYSGRSVIVNNPKLKLNEIGLPIDIAREAYKPFFIKKLRDIGVTASYTEAEKIYKQNTPEVLDALRKTVAERPLILNRAPTLHKHSVLAFNPVLTENKSIELNSVITTPFNADFDGDQMQVIVPVTQKAVDEAKELLMPSKNLISPTGGKIIMELKHEMLLGLWYMTQQHEFNASKAQEYTSLEALRKDFWDNKLKTHDPVKYEGKTATAGQHIFASYLPRSVRETYFGKEITNKVAGQIVKEVLDKEGATIATKLIDDLKELGFKASTKSSLSLGIKDFVDDEKFKKKFITDTEKRIAERVVEEVEKNVKQSPDKAVAALMDADEAVQMIVADEYSKTQEQMDSAYAALLPKDNPLKAMQVSGARAKPDQIRRMTGMVGVGQDIVGKWIPFPIRSSHLEGLSPSEYFVHAMDSRRGMADRSLSTQEPGTLTKELYFSLQQQVISMKDCNDAAGTPYSVNGDLGKSLIGRMFAQAVSLPGKRIAAGKMCTPEIYEELKKNASKVPIVHMRSPLSCKAPQGVCSVCYGAKPGEMTLYDMGASIGSIASQAIGEPTSQGTMNTFHSGSIHGVSSGFDALRTVFHVPKEARSAAILAEEAGTVTDVDDKGLIRFVKVDGKRYSIPLGKEILKHIVPGYRVEAMEPLTEGYKDPRAIAEKMGIMQARKDFAADIVKTINGVLKPGVVDPRHAELAAATLTSRALVVDPGSANITNQDFFPTGDLMKGQIVDKNILDTWNQSASKPVKINTLQRDDLIGTTAAETVKKRGNVIVSEGQEITEPIADALKLAVRAVKVYPKKIVYKPKVFGAGSSYVGSIDNNWFVRTSFGNMDNSLREGALMGQVDLLDQPVSRMATGKLMNVGSGFKDWLKEKTRDFSQGITALFQ